MAEIANAKKCNLLDLIFTSPHFEVRWHDHYLLLLSQFFCQNTAVASPKSGLNYQNHNSIQYT